MFAWIARLIAGFTPTKWAALKPTVRERFEACGFRSFWIWLASLLLLFPVSCSIGRWTSNKNTLLLKEKDAAEERNKTLSGENNDLKDKLKTAIEEKVDLGVSKKELVILNDKLKAWEKKGASLEKDALKLAKDRIQLEAERITFTKEEMRKKADLAAKEAVLAKKEADFATKEAEYKKLKAEAEKRKGASLARPPSYGSGVPSVVALQEMANIQKACKDLYYQDIREYARVRNLSQLYAWQIAHVQRQGASQALCRRYEQLAGIGSGLPATVPRQRDWRPSIVRGMDVIANRSYWRYGKSTDAWTPIPIRKE